MMKVEEFREQLAEKKILLNAGQLEQFAIYCDLLIEWNKKINLTAIVDPEEIYEKHFFDSILPFIQYRPDGRLCDVGTGAGFPGVVAKIVFPDIDLTLLEPINKRIVFLNDVCEKLKLSGVRCVNARAEDFVKEHRESYDVVTARAVAGLNILSELCLPLVKPSGLFIAMKGINGYQEYLQAQRAIMMLGGTLIDKGECLLNEEIVRYNLVFRKTSPTPEKYPRNYSQIKKKPL